MHDVQSMDRSYKQAGDMSVQRKSFVFSADVSERLERLASATRLESNSSVVRLALVVLEDLVEAIARGDKITIEDESGVFFAGAKLQLCSRRHRLSHAASLTLWNAKRRRMPYMAFYGPLHEQLG